MSTARTHPSPAPGPARRTTTTLQTGDRLTRAEFERRYAAHPEIKKAELVEGIVYMGSPVRSKQHGQPHADLSGWMFTYKARTHGVILEDNTTYRIDEDNEPQPDLMLRLPAAPGGRSRIDDDGYVAGVPDLLAEVAASSVSLDTHLKKQVYRRQAVPEYLVWRVEDEAIDWLIFREGEYVPLNPDDGLLKSPRFPGLWLDAGALLAGDLPRLLAALDRGLATPEHAAFIERLRTGPNP